MHPRIAHNINLIINFIQAEEMNVVFKNDISVKFTGVGKLYSGYLKRAI